MGRLAILCNILIVFVLHIRTSAFATDLSMAYRAKGQNNEDLVQQLTDYGIIITNCVARVMNQTDRKFYCPNKPYVDAPQSIGYKATISAPHMHAFALERLRDHLTPGARVLDVGSGSGYLTACFLRFIRLQEMLGHHDVNNSATRVIGIEHFPELVGISKANLNADDPDLLASGQLQIVEEDGRKGYPEFAPYNAIHVGAASPEMPHNLIEQLANGGRLIVPIGPKDGQQHMYQIDKDEQGNVTATTMKSVIFVPLTDNTKYH